MVNTIRAFCFWFLFSPKLRVKLYLPRFPAQQLERCCTQNFGAYVKRKVNLLDTGFVRMNYE